MSSDKSRVDATNPHAGIAPKKLLPTFPRDNLLEVMRDLIDTSNRDRGHRQQDNPSPRHQGLGLGGGGGGGPAVL